MTRAAAKTIFAAGATWPGIHVWDDRRPHSFTPDMQDEAFAWFDRWL